MKKYKSIQGNIVACSAALKPHLRFVGVSLNWHRSHCFHVLLSLWLLFGYRRGTALVLNSVGFVFFSPRTECCSRWFKSHWGFASQYRCTLYGYWTRNGRSGLQVIVSISLGPHDPHVCFLNYMYFIFSLSANKIFLSFCTLDRKWPAQPRLG